MATIVSQATQSNVGFAPLEEASQKCTILYSFHKKEKIFWSIQVAVKSNGSPVDGLHPLESENQSRWQGEAEWNRKWNGNRKFSLSRP